jgi:hypothetical protein
MIDRIVHYAEVLTLKGASYRLRNTGIDTLPSVRADNAAQRIHRCGLVSVRREWTRFRPLFTLTVLMIAAVVSPGYELGVRMWRGWEGRRSLIRERHILFGVLQFM